jgi:murein DD-endopeptidase MepM/ murein hydrolase activator NlpD
MRWRVCSEHWVAVSRIALVGLIGSAAAACSSDSARFAENPFSNPFAASERMDNNAAAAPQPAPSYAAAAPMPTASIQSQALPPVQSQPLSQSSRVAAAPAPIQPRPAPVASAQPAGQTKFRFVDPKTAAAEPTTPVEPSKRVRPGMMQAQAPAPMPLAPAPVKQAQAPVKLAPVQVASATAEPLVSAPKPVVEQPRVAALTQPEAVKAAPVVQPVAPAQAPQPEAAKAPVQEPEQTASVAADFRWPARGRVIAGFGANGGNEGINIAVPEGTPVKAAEAGTVTYAGSEVKGYGNLILVRHENGYVSAYAHNGSLSVKRGDQVKRGQVIAISGQTGNVTSPQLHFELRKGATPVDPMPHLGG